MDSSTDLSCTYVSAFAQSHKTKEHHNLPSSQLLISCNVWVTYQLDSPPNPKLSTSNLDKQAISKISRINEEYGDSFLRCSCNSITRYLDGENPIAKMVSELIPFTLENIQFRSNHGSWTPLHSTEDLVKGISEVAASLVGENEYLPFKEYYMHVAMEKKVVLPREKYEAKVKAKLEREISAGLREYLVERQLAEGGGLSKSDLARIARDELENKKVDVRIMSNPRFISRVLDEVETEIRERARRRQRKILATTLEEKLEKVKVDGGVVHELGQGWECSICHNGLGELGSCVARLPCRHVFHNKCIRGWVIKKTNCPLCRVNLS